MTCSRCEDLQEEVAYLKSELGLQVDGDVLATIKRAFGLTDQKARIVVILFKAKGRVVSEAHFQDALPSRYGATDRGEKLVHSSISQLRKVVGADAIETVYARGYRLSPGMRARVAEALA